ncbi:MAG: cytidine deaminase [Candidatus Saccharibacteria bacterium]|nr:cytidine deaminase [Candidatus Saccharibacteria bacterium]
MDWDEYFLKIAETVALRSKDPSTKVGTVIVDEKRRPVSFGYNGLIQGADESKLTLTERPMKYYFSMHSEINAIIFAHRDLSGCTCYSVYAPCVDCLRFLLQAGVTRIVYKNAHVESHKNKAKHSMQNSETDTAIIALLDAMPHVEVINYTTGKTYKEELSTEK